MGQISRSTERISSYKYNNSKAETKEKHVKAQIKQLN